MKENLDLVTNRKGRARKKGRGEEEVTARDKIVLRAHPSYLRPPARFLLLLTFHYLGTKPLRHWPWGLILCRK